mmetsp:Transcript_16822/g.35113  ORF Transcript_16822/g.35113 Transcript_16822/m.35113 type:complete len:233 (+) Transcript_16822:85-783(+)
MWSAFAQTRKCFTSQCMRSTRVAWTPSQAATPVTPLAAWLSWSRTGRLQRCSSARGRRQRSGPQARMRVACFSTSPLRRAPPTWPQRWKPACRTPSPKCAWGRLRPITSPLPWTSPWLFRPLDAHAMPSELGTACGGCIPLTSSGLRARTFDALSPPCGSNMPTSSWLFRPMEARIMPRSVCGRHPPSASTSLRAQARDALLLPRGCSVTASPRLFHPMEAHIMPSATGTAC